MITASVSIGAAAAGLASIPNLFSELLRRNADDEPVELGRQLDLAAEAALLAHIERDEPKQTQKALAKERIRSGRPQPLPNPGVIASSNSIATPAILPDGTITVELPRYTAAAMVVDVPLSTTTTPAVVIGRGVEGGVAVLGLGALIGAALGGRRR